LGCSGATPEARDPADSPVGVAGVQLDGEDPGPDDPGSLPQYFSLEVRSDGIWLDSKRVELNELDNVLARGAGDPRNRGVAVILYGTRPAIGEILERVARAGFTHVLVSGLSVDAFAAKPEVTSEGGECATPTATNAASTGANVGDTVAADTAPAGDTAKAGDAAEPDQVESGSQPPPLEDVSVKHYGMHIGGGPNTEQAKARYLDPIERRFDELRNCHVLAKNRKVQASFGVDLLIGSQGGRAKIKDYRTQLSGKDFQMCVLGILGEVRFPVPERATVVSYSILFKPSKP
jgi:hypothetical protein